ncbi:MAG TPA: lysylphosphatidylglycerol synthase domain-containing protein [Xanthobacteraceae bacterium]
MSRPQSILTGIATAIALILVFVSVDFGRLLPSLHQLKATPVVLAVALLIANFLLVFLRFEWTLRALGVTMDRRTAAYAFSLGNLASQFLLNIIGQSLTRAVVLKTSGVPMSATVAATYLERLIALSTVGIGAVGAALLLFGSVGFEMHAGGAYFLSLAIGISATLACAGIRGITWAIAPDELRRIGGTTVRLAPAFAISIAAHLAMFGAYMVLVRAFAPDIGLAKLAPAIVIVMFAAGIPISWAGWGLREFGAVYAFNAIGMPSEAAVIVAVTIGAVSLLIALAAGAAVVVDSWLRPSPRLNARHKEDSLVGALAPSDPFFLLAIGILVACLIFFQLRVPSGADEITINAADPFALTALFFAIVFAWTDGFRRLFARPVIWSICGLVAVLAVGILVAWLGAGVSEWALINRMLGFCVLLGYAAVPGLITLVAGERGRTILADTFALAAVVICATQLLAYAIHLYVVPLPLDYFGYLFPKGAQLEGYAQNPNAFAFQLLMAASVLIAFHPSLSPRLASRWGTLGAGVLLATIMIARSRAAIVCALAAIGLTIVLRKLPGRHHVTRKSLVISLLAVALVAVIGFAFRGTIDRLIIEPFNGAWRPGADESDAQRWQSNILGFQAWLQHPFFGNGLGTFLRDREAAGLPALVIHSVPVWFLAEMGVVGLGAYLFFVASLLYCGISALRRQEAQARGLLVIVAVFILMGLVHDIFFQRTFWFAISLAVLNVGPMGEESRPSDRVNKVGGEGGI